MRKDIKGVLVILGCFLFIFNLFSISKGQGTSDVDFSIEQNLICDFNNDIWDSNTIFYNCEIDGNEILTRGWEFNMNNETDEQYVLSYNNADNWTDLYETDNFDYLAYDTSDYINTTHPTITYYYYDIERELINYDYEVNGNDYYYAIYSFTDDANGANPRGFSIDETGGSINVIASENNHNKVVELFDNNAGSNVDIFNYFEQEYGTIEFYLSADNVNNNFAIYFRGGGSNCMGIAFNVNNFQYYDGVWNNFMAVAVDTWYHVRIDFECGSGGYEGLSSDTYYIYIDDVQYGSYSFGVVSDNIDTFWGLTSTAGANWRVYIDALGYSWYNSYEIGYNSYDGFEFYGFTKNLYQLYFNETTNDDWDLIFHFSVDQYQDFIDYFPTLYITLQNDDYESILEYRVHVNDNDNSTYTLYYYTDYGAELEVYNFTLSDDIEIRLEPYNSVFYDDNRLNVDIYNNGILNYTNNMFLAYDSNLVNNIGNLTYYVLENNSVSGTNKFHCDYIYALSNDIYLHDDRSSWIYFPYLDVDYSTGYLASSRYISDELYFLHDIIGCYSLWFTPYDNFYDYPRVIDGWDYCIQSWRNYTENELKFRNMLGVAQYPVSYLSTSGYHFYMKIFGNLTVDDFRVFHSIYLDSTTHDSNMLTLNNWDTSITGFGENHFDTSIDFNNTYLYELDNTFQYPDTSETYSIYSDWYYTSYFFIANQELNINYNVVNNTLEYIDLGFEFLPQDYFYTSNYSLQYDYYKRGAMTGYNILNYITRYSSFTLTNYWNYHQEFQIFSQNEYLDEFRIILTDRDNDALTNTTTNYFVLRNLSFVITEGVALTILTATILEMLIPFISILTPSMAITLKTDKKLFIPLFLIFTVALTIVEMIPVWLFFVIFISLSAYLFINRESEQNVI